MKLYTYKSLQLVATNEFREVKIGEYFIDAFNQPALNYEGYGFISTSNGLKRKILSPIYECKGKEYIETGEVRKPEKDEWYFNKVSKAPMKATFNWTMEDAKILKPLNPVIPEPVNPCKGILVGASQVWQDGIPLKVAVVHPKTLDRLRVMTAIEKIEEEIKDYEDSHDKLISQGLDRVADNFYIKLGLTKALTILKGVLE
jgi:hypothetical protein